MEAFFNRLAARPQRSILLLGLLLLLAGNWILPLTDRDEARFGEASREMIQRGDYIVPWFNGAWRFDKPVFIYWCQIASYKILGVNDFAARLPSALFATATALLLVRWGRKIADNKTALLAGVMYVAGLHVAVIGRIATADMAMIFFFTLAVWSGWELTRPAHTLTPSPRPSGERAGVRGFEPDEKSSSSPLPSPPLHGREGENSVQRRKWWWIFYVALALGFLAKGPVAWLPLGGMILGRSFRKNAFRLPLTETLAGLCVTVALVALWGVPALLQTGGQFWKVGMGEHVFNRSFGVIDRHGIAGIAGFLALPLYFLTFFASFFPWSIQKPSGLQVWWLNPKQKNHYWELLAKIIRLIAPIIFVPIQIWRWWPERKRDEIGWYLLTQAAVVFAVFSLVKTKLPHYTLPAFPVIALWLARQIGGAPGISAWAGKRLAAMSAFILVLTLGLFPFAEKHLLTENLWRATRPYVRPETKIGCFGYTEPSQVWRFRSVITNDVTLGNVKQAASFLTNAPPFILVLPTGDLAKLPDTNGLLFQVRGLDLVKFQNRDLTAIVRP